MTTIPTTSGRRLATEGTKDGDGASLVNGNGRGSDAKRFTKDTKDGNGVT